MLLKIVFALFVSANSFLWADCLTPSPECLRILKVGQSSSIEYYSNYSLLAENQSITRAVILIHGVLSNANDYYETLVRAAEKKEGVLLIAPRFSSDVSSFLRWEGTSWKRGDDSTSSIETLSSFDVMDILINQLLHSGHFPQLKAIVVAGHSGGGQFVSRYSAATRINSKLLKFVIGNPSSYLYFNKWRSGFEGFEVPSNCEEYNDYPYGLKSPNRYMKLAMQGIVERFLDRDVTVFLGELDTETADLDMSCEAMAQGLNRLERGKNFFQTVRHFFQSPKTSLVIVPNVGHDGRLMYTSLQGVRMLFETQP